MNLLAPNILNIIEQTVFEYLMVCNNKELALLINEKLEENNMALIDEALLVKFLNGKVDADIVIDPAYQKLGRLIRRAMIDRKQILFQKYEATTEWQEKSKIEYLLNTRFPKFGQEPEEAGIAVSGGGNIVINIDNRKIELAQPITSEAQMLGEADALITQYLVAHKINAEYDIL